MNVEGIVGGRTWGTETAALLRRWAFPPGSGLPCLPADVGDAATTFVTLVTDDAFDLPLPGDGATLQRFTALAEVCARDLSLGRLLEGHADALAVLAECGKAPPSSAVMGVWAAHGRGAHLTATPKARTGRSRGWLLQGRKPWASGAGTVTHALVTAAAPDGDRLFEVPVAGEGVSIVPGTWPAVGMAMSDSADVEFDLVVEPDREVGPPGWYVNRPGFWFGSVGVAACWLGGALGLVRALRDDMTHRCADPHQLAHLGAASACVASMARDIAWAAGRIDAAPVDPGREIRPVALEVRHLVEDGCLAVLTHVGHAGGADPLCHDPAQSRRLADLAVYIRQHHAGRDDEQLGRCFLDPDE